MDYLLIQSHGEVHPLELELLGASSKAKDQRTIGMFGSGAKYAVALALRLGIDVRVTTNEWQLQFEFEEQQVRDNTYKVLVYTLTKPNNSRRTKKRTSMSLGAGERNWTEPWFIIREFFANAMDAQTQTGVAFTTDIVTDIEYAPQGKTNVYLQFTPVIADIVSHINEYMKTSDKPIYEGSYGRIFQRAGTGIRFYHKGMLVFHSKTDTGCYDYDLPNLELTEERTPKNEWHVHWSLRRLLDDAPDDIKEVIIRHISDKLYYESKIDWEYTSTPNKWADAFEKAFPDGVACPDAQIIKEELLCAQKRPVVVPDNFLKALDKSDKKITSEKFLGYDPNKFKVIEPEGYVLDLMERAKDLLAPDFPEQVATQIKYFSPTIGTDLETVVAFIKDGAVFVNPGLIKNISDATSMLLEEYMHLKTGASDYSRHLVDAICKYAVTKLFQSRAK